jgi:hypothetical protein
MSSRARVVEPDRLAQWCTEHLGSPPADEIFRSGNLSAVIPEFGHPSAQAGRCVDRVECLVRVVGEGSAAMMMFVWPGSASCG